MNDKDDIRKSVSKAYARAVSKPAKSSCCPPAQKGAAVKAAGYSHDELEALPEEAVVNSFGCGNPLAFSGVREGDVVLDLGSGAGIDLLIAARMVGSSGRVIGVDMTDAMIEKAKETVAAAGHTNVEVRKGLIEELPVDSGSVDWVISNCVINLSPEKDRVFAEIARVLKPGGRMLVTDIVADDLPDAVKKDLDYYCSCVGGAISEAAYCAGLSRAGLVDVEIRERIEYTSGQIGDIVESGMDAYQGVETGCCGVEPGLSIQDLATLCNGKVWSAKIFARKPE
ncbi:MAG: arsenite methyltransferase [Planctomycetota bacterium]|jgi:SAM-dependent methyltransferase